MTHFELLKYAKTGIASPEMTAYDKMRAAAMASGGAVKTLTGVPPLTFKANGKPLISWSMKGNGQQNGTPSPDNIIMPEFCGKLVGTDWIIPITNAGQTTPVYLGQVQTLRKIRKLVLTGEENWTIDTNRFTIEIQNFKTSGLRLTQLFCSHFQAISDGRPYADVPDNSVYSGSSDSYTKVYFHYSTAQTLSDWKTFLQQQHTSTPVTIWYVLANEQTGIVNEPLAKIGTYADTLHSTDAGVSIPTAKGANTLTVDTELQPSSMTITYR